MSEYEHESFSKQVIGVGSLDKSYASGVFFSSRVNPGGGESTAGPSNVTPVLGESTDFSTDVNRTAGNGSLPAPSTATPTAPLANESLFYPDSFATSDMRALRDSVIDSGYNPAVSNQPYAGRLSEKMKEIFKRDNNLQDLDTLPPKDREYINVILSELHNPYNPNKHYPNTGKVRSFLKKLP